MRKHIFYKDPVSSGAVLNKNMGNRADKLTILDNRRPAQGHVNTGVKDFSRFLKKKLAFVENSTLSSTFDLT